MPKDKVPVNVDNLPRRQQVQNSRPDARPAVRQARQQSLGFFEGIAAWFNKQHGYYKAQMLYSERDRLHAENFAGVDRMNARLGKETAISEYEKEAKVLGAKRDFWESPQAGGKSRVEKLMDIDGKIMNAVGDSPDPETARSGKSLGGFFGRLFGGRFTAASLRRADANLQRTLTPDGGYTIDDDARFNKLREYRAASEKALSEAAGHPLSAKNRRDAFIAAMAADQNIPASEATSEWVSKMVSSKYAKWQRQLPALMRTGGTPEDLAYNQRVVNAFSDANTDSKGLVQDQPLAARAIKEAVDRFRDYDVNAIDLKNPMNNKDIYPHLEAFQNTGHLLRDMYRPNAALSDESFKGICPTEQDKFNMTQKIDYIMSASAGTRLEMLKHAQYDPKYILPSEARHGGSAEQFKAYADMKYDMLAHPSGLAGKTSFNDYVNHRLEVDKQSFDPSRDERFWTPEQRQKDQEWQNLKAEEEKKPREQRAAVPPRPRGDLKNEVEKDKEHIESLKPKPEPKPEPKKEPKKEPKEQKEISSEPRKSIKLPEKQARQSVGRTF